MDKRKATDAAPEDNVKDEAPVKRSRAKYDEPPSDSEGSEDSEGDDEEESEFEDDDFESDGGDDLDALSEPEVEPSSRRSRNRNIDYKKLAEDFEQDLEENEEEAAKEEADKEAKEEAEQDE